MSARYASRIGGVTPSVLLAASYFEASYDRIAFGSPSNLIKYVGQNSDPKRCRYCGRTAPSVTFEELAHALPEFTGNKTLFSFDECDGCNQTSSHYEDDLGKMTHALRSFGRVRGKKNVPTFHSRAKLSEIREQDKKLTIKVREDDETFRVVRTSSGFRADLQAPSFRPLGVYKALVKMAMAVLPQEELSTFQDVLDWLSKEGLNECKPGFLFSPFAIETITSGPQPFPYPLYEVYRRRIGAEGVPYAHFVVHFGNFTYQVVLPCRLQDIALTTKRALDLVAIPSPYALTDRYPYFAGRPRRLELASEELLKAMPQSLNMHAEYSTTAPPTPTAGP